MNNSAVDALIYRYTHKLTVQLVKDGRIVMLSTLLISLCLLLSLKAFVVSAILLILAVVFYVYLTLIVRRKALTIYDGIGTSTVLYFSLVVFFNVAIYTVQIHLGSNSMIPMIVIFLIEIVSLFAGFYHVFKYIEKGVVKKGNSVVSKSSYAISGIVGLYLAKSIFAQTSVGFQYFFFTVFFAFVNLITMFFMGMTCLSCIYYIRKYKIADRLIGNTGDDTPSNTGDGSLC